MVDVGDEITYDWDHRMVWLSPAKFVELPVVKIHVPQEHSRTTLCMVV